MLVFNPKTHDYELEVSQPNVISLSPQIELQVFDCKEKDLREELRKEQSIETQLLFDVFFKEEKELLVSLFKQRALTGQEDLPGPHNSGIEQEESFELF